MDMTPKDLTTSWSREKNYFWRNYKNFNITPAPRSQKNLQEKATIFSKNRTNWGMAKTKNFNFNYTNNYFN